jgi:hypothetical protein
MRSRYDVTMKNKANLVMLETIHQLYESKRIL